MPTTRIEKQLKTVSVLLVVNAFLVVGMGVASLVTLHANRSDRARQIDDLRQDLAVTFRSRDAARRMEFLEVTGSIDKIINRLMKLEGEVHDSATQPVSK